MIGLALLWVAAERYGIAGHLKKVSRVAGYTFVVSTVFGAVSLHKAHAAFQERGLDLGEDLASMSSVLQDANAITINGQRIHIATGVTREGRAQVLDEFVASCKANAPPDTPVWNALPDPNDPHPRDFDSMPIYREETGHKGIALCISPSKNTPKRGLKEALDAFFATGEMSELGRFRYVYVTEDSKGTDVVNVWTDEKFNVFAITPEPGKESTGSDPQIMLRPTNASRLISASVDGLPYRVYAYRSAVPAKEAIDAYDTQMHAAGWVSVAHPMMEGSPHEGREVRGYLRNGVTGYVTVMTDEKGVTLFAVGESGTLEHGPIAAPKEADGF